MTHGPGMGRQGLLAWLGEGGDDLLLLLRGQAGHGTGSFRGGVGCGFRGVQSGYVQRAAMLPFVPERMSPPTPTPTPSRRPTTLACPAPHPPPTRAPAPHQDFRSRQRQHFARRDVEGQAADMVQVAVGD